MLTRIMMIDSKYQEALDKPLTLRGFTEFFQQFIEPSLREIPLINSRIDNLERKWDDRWDFLFKKYEDFSQEYLVINHQLKRIDQRLEDIESRLEKVEARLTSLEIRVSSLERRVSDLENEVKILQAQMVQSHERLQRIEDSGKRDRRDDEIFKSDLAQLKTQVDDIEHRVEILEKN